MTASTHALFNAQSEPLTIGVGCRRGVSAAQVDAAVRAALGTFGTLGILAFEQIRTVATLDTKAGEAGLAAFCALHRLPLRTFTREQIATLDALPGASARVHAHVGVNGVCEPCALLAEPGGRLLVQKHALDGVAVAIACAASNQHSS